MQSFPNACLCGFIRTAAGYSPLAATEGRLFRANAVQNMAHHVQHHCREAMVPNRRTFIRWLSDIGIGDVPLVAGKNASLGEIQLEVRLERALDVLRTFVRETACAAGGHDYLVQASANRICLRCTDCGHETPGWPIGASVTPNRDVSTRAH